jgi:hypothetical protein
MTGLIGRGGVAAFTAFGVTEIAGVCFCRTGVCPDDVAAADGRSIAGGCVAGARFAPAPGAERVYPCTYVPSVRV